MVTVLGSQSGLTFVQNANETSMTLFKLHLHTSLHPRPRAQNGGGKCHRSCSSELAGVISLPVNMKKFTVDVMADSS